ncbi:MAG: hypothetical protein OEL77_08920, partial [Nitrosopumilus sp.]|nr:hypothetical protein [Nitrosopumilus sp.]
MTSIDKAAIGFTIAIVAIGVAFAAFGGMAQNNPPTVSAPIVSAPLAPVEESIQTDPFAKLASDVKEQSEAEKMPTEKMAAEKMAAEKMAAEKMAAEKMAAEKMAAEKMAAESSGPQTVSVDIPTGTAVPGCEETDECYLPPSVTIKKGDTVEWTNSDTAAHTVTGGSPADGPSGVFDSSLILGGAQYAFT